MQKLAINNILTAMREKGQGLRRIGLVIAIAIFLIGSAIAIRHAPNGLSHINLTIVVFYAALIPPIAYVIQSLELWLTAKAVGVSLSIGRTIEITLYSNASTLLPIPGGLLTRTIALRSYGVPVARSASVVMLFTGIAGTVAFTYAGLWLIKSSLLVALASLGVAGLGAATCFVLGLRLKVARSVIGKATALRLFTVLYETVSYAVMFAAIGADVGFEQTAVLVISGFIAMALMIFPAGFGVREAIVAFISPLVGIDPATGFLAAAAIRIISMGWLAAIGVGILVRGRGREGDQGKNEQLG